MYSAGIALHCHNSVIGWPWPHPADSRVTGARQVPLHHAVLALLSDGPGYGYELKTQFEEAIGPQWGGLNIGHLYQILDRLERDGYVARSHVSQPSRPDKTLYTLTSASEQELRGWATEAWVRTSGFRDELFLKLLGASRLGSDALTALLRQRSAVPAYRISVH